MAEPTKCSSMLFVDDDAMDLRLYRYFTSMHGPVDIDTAYAQSIPDAIEHLQRQSFDLVFLDHRMPPFHDYRESIDILSPFLGKAVVYMISGLSQANLPSTPPHPRVSGLLDKHEMRQIFTAGFADRLIDAG